MEILALAGLILLNGLFAMSEIALVVSRLGRLQKQGEGGDMSARAAIELRKDPNRFLSTVQIGITSIGVLSGIIGEATLAAPLAQWLESVGLDQKPSSYIATGLVVVTITYFSIVFGELVPKRIGQINPEPIARLVSRPMMLLATLSKPFVFLLAGSTKMMLRVLGVKEISGSAVTEEEIHAMLEEGSDSGVIEKQEHAMVRNVFRLDDRQIDSLMVPRRDVVYLDVERSLDENLDTIRQSEHSRFPVCRGGLRDILGIVSARQLLAQTLDGVKPDLTANLQPAVFVPETQTGMELLENFKATHVQLAIVIDEYGEVQGIVTLQDVMEAITGEFKPRHAKDAWAVRRDDGSWLLDGLIPIPELKDRLDLGETPEEARNRYNTLSGMLMYLFERIPQTGDRVSWDGWDFEVVDLDGKRIDKVLATPVIAEPEH